MLILHFDRNGDEFICVVRFVDSATISFAARLLEAGKASKERQNRPKEHLESPWADYQF
jgi:hypothetical protein